ncbi:hypothetical protein HMPREF9120_01466 [Neisseria sp. oral taxon 020 str. F0370]|nr:hypothetical protein HMPREF9120_01466 [Neisseria sp. oral taxon 020 str. F0370]
MLPCIFFILTHYNASAAASRTREKPIRPSERGKQAFRRPYLPDLRGGRTGFVYG